MARTRIDAKKKGGRPPKLPGSPKRASFNTRLRDAVKERLERKAASQGRSLSEEIEARLEASLADEDNQRTFLGGAATFNLARQIAAIAAGAEQEIGRGTWDQDYLTFKAVTAGWRRLLDLLDERSMPKPDQETSEMFRPAMDKFDELRKVNDERDRLMAARPELPAPPSRGLLETLRTLSNGEPDAAAEPPEADRQAAAAWADQMAVLEREQTRIGQEIQAAIDRQPDPKNAGIRIVERLLAAEKK